MRSSTRDGDPRLPSLGSVSRTNLGVLARCEGGPIGAPYGGLATSYRRGVSVDDELTSSILRHSLNSFCMNSDMYAGLDIYRVMRFSGIKLGAGIITSLSSSLALLTSSRRSLVSGGFFSASLAQWRRRDGSGGARDATPEAHRHRAPAPIPHACFRFLWAGNGCRSRQGKLPMAGMAEERPG